MTLTFKKEPKLCFNCILNPEKKIEADLSLSKALYSNSSFTTIEGADIKVYESDSLLGVLQDMGGGKYQMDAFPRKGKTYQVVVIVEGYPELKAITKVPGGVPVKYITKAVDVKEKTFEFTVRICDMPGNNYYWYYGYSEANGNKYDSGIISNIYAPFFDDFNKQIEPESKYGFQYWYMVRINDQVYDGDTLQWSVVRAKSKIYTSVSKLMEVDDNYDKYLKTTVQMRMLDIDEIPLSEPVQIYSNIENGYGIFGSCIMHTNKITP
ncbi:MAG TPA: DUF4249 domain-containing protein [Draconibacterium sp.]|nr:DUF4249 domain-containing protein [Draconibacterium sp.]